LSHSVSLNGHFRAKLIILQWLFEWQGMVLHFFLVFWDRI
jgi:hypothetical protein